jgi:hypothetical protein
MSNGCVAGFLKMLCDRKHHNVNGEALDFQAGCHWIIAGNSVNRKYQSANIQAD